MFCNYTTNLKLSTAPISHEAGPFPEHSEIQLHYYISGTNRSQFFLGDNIRSERTRRAVYTRHRSHSIHYVQIASDSHQRCRIVRAFGTMQRVPNHTSASEAPAEECHCTSGQRYKPTCQMDCKFNNFASCKYLILALSCLFHFNYKIVVFVHCSKGSRLVLAITAERMVRQSERLQHNVQAKWNKRHSVHCY